MSKLTIRHDDFDFRMQPQEYIDLHEEFIGHGLIETAVVQLTASGRIHDYKPELIEYMNTAPNWNIQLHGWSHDIYSKMSWDDIARDLSASCFLFKRLFGKVPTVWYPPHNEKTEEMEKAAVWAGIKIDNESYDIAEFTKQMETGTFSGNSVYFHLWENGKKHLIPTMLKLAKQYENR